MEFIDIATEQTTAATDAIMGIMAIVAVVYLRRIGQHRPRKAALWMWVFGLLAVAGILGTIVHGFKMSEALEDFLWHPLYLSLGLVVAFFIVATVYDIWGERAAQRVLPIMIAVGVGFFALTLVWPDSFLVFIIYEAVAMLFALGGYIWLAFRRFAGAWLMTAGVLVTIIAAGVQASGAVAFTLIWSFDYNGAYHLIQMIGIVLLVAGLRAALRPHINSTE
ncbi:MAG: hypothetical protein JXB30_20100 [Anaerolineae bacterium]|nr:hypothetical protein [Anaerolineae bacterium]